MITGHGDDRYRYHEPVIADFSSNVWYDAPSPAIIEHLQKQWATINHYPEPAAETLTGKLAETNHCTPAQILVTNGSTDAFYLIAQTFAKQSSTILTPSFVEYADACHLHDHSVKYIHRRKNWQDNINNTDLLWLGSPNNPDGKVFAAQEIREVLKKNPRTLVVIDEAYCDLCYDHEPIIFLLKEFENLILIRSFTKAFAIPGIRLGYMLGSVKYIAAVRKYLVPWSVNHLAQQAGLFILDHEQSLRPDRARLKQEQEAFQQHLQTIGEIEVIPSSCNFNLVRLKKGRSTEMKKFLLRNHGILIRDAANFKGLDENYIRLALQDEKSNQLLFEGLKQYFS